MGQLEATAILLLVFAAFGVACSPNDSVEPDSWSLTDGADTRSLDDAASDADIQDELTDALVCEVMDGHDRCSAAGCNTYRQFFEFCVDETGECTKELVPICTDLPARGGDGAVARYFLERPDGDARVVNFGSNQGDSVNGWRACDATEPRPTACECPEDARRGECP